MGKQVLIASEVGLIEDGINAIGQSYGFDALLLTEADLSSSFFDLQTGIAGELFQKCTNYHLRLAVVVQDLSIYSPRVAELAFEHQNHRLIRFFSAIADAKSWLQT
jgi:hypothetical protein